MDKLVNERHHEGKLKTKQYDKRQIGLNLRDYDWDGLYYFWKFPHTKLASENGYLGKIFR